MNNYTDIDIVKNLFAAICYFVKNNKVECIENLIYEFEDDELKNCIIQYSLKQLVLFNLLSVEEYSILSQQTAEKFFVSEKGGE
jgi:hypothetical protein